MLPKDISLGKGWVMKFNVGMNIIDIFYQCLEKVEGTLSILKRHTLEEIESIHNDLEGPMQA